MTNKQYFLLCKDWMKYSKEFGVEQLKSFDNTITGAHADIGMYKGEYILCFRGTEKKANDILMDCLFFKTSTFLIGMGFNILSRVHFGFATQYLSISYDIIKCLKNNVYDRNVKIKVIGHSLGGALATFATHEISNLLPYSNVVGIVFGSPRVGNVVFKNKFDAKLTNIQNVNDLVCHLPLKIMGFHHVGTIKKVGKFRFWRLFRPDIWHENYDGFLE